VQRPVASSPPIVLTVADPATSNDPDLVTRKNALYAAAIAEAGGHPILLTATSTDPERAAAFARMEGLLLCGGADVDPARYGRASVGAVATEPERDTLEHEAWTAASDRGVPILGICRGMQAINVFSGGALVQHVEAHAGPGWGVGPAATHPLRLAPGSRLTRILFPTNARGAALTVNSYHHQGIRAADLAPALVANAFAASPLGDLVEGLEAADGRFVIGVQCHPERAESTPPAFRRLFSVFVDAARGPASRR
jgi:gamma-glutamyl-gamma-aminobutyrate hydrolase PuuD